LSTGSRSPRPTLLEKLEARILLSADGLLTASPPDPLQDSTQPMAQHAELLEANEQIEQEPSPEQGTRREADRSHQIETNRLQPVLTLSFEESNVADDSVPTDEDVCSLHGRSEPSDDLCLDEIGPVQTGHGPTVLSDGSDENTDNETSTTDVVYTTAEEPTTSGPAVPTEDGSAPIETDDAGPSFEYATSIEIRGPPADNGECSNTFNPNTYVTSDGYAETPAVECVDPLQTPDLPGLQLIDPNPSNLQGQTVYLSVDGERAVIYDGPVAVMPFDVPAFRAPARLAGRESDIISSVIFELNHTFAGSGLVFTAEQPSDEFEYSTVYLCGEDSVFSEYGSLLGVAEKVDVGNQDRSDQAFVFAREILLNQSDVDQAAHELASVVAHETGHLLGYEHVCQTSGGFLSELALESPETLTIATASPLPDAAVEAPYSVFFEAEGGAQPYRWSVTGDLYDERDPGLGAVGGGVAMGWRSDDASYALTLPWAFAFYGTAYTTVRVCTNGYLDFTSSTADYSNSTAELLSSVRIAPLWDDLRTDGAGEDIYVDTTDPEAVAIRWDGRTYQNSAPVDFMVTLYRQGTIRFDYGAAHAGLTPTIGLSAGDGSRYTLSARDGASGLPANEATLWSPLPPGLSLTPTTGQLHGTPTTPGSYTFTIRVTDALAHEAAKPFTLAVTELPDLIGASCNALPDPHSWGESFELDYTVLNQGTGQAGPFDIGFYLSEDTDYDAGSDTLLTFVSAPGGLAAGASLSGTVTLTLPSSSPFAGPYGTFYVVMFSDDLDEVAEANETNNHGTGYRADYDEFTIVPPHVAHSPNPADGAIHEDTWVSLSWVAGSTAVSHDVYFGESYADVQAGTGGTFRGNQVSTFFVAGFPGFPYPDGLVPGTTYYWRIDEVEADGVTIHPGYVWSFTTGDFLLVDALESYTE